MSLQKSEDIHVANKVNDNKEAKSMATKMTIHVKWALPSIKHTQTRGYMNDDELHCLKQR